MAVLIALAAAVRPSLEPPTRVRRPALPLEGGVPEPLPLPVFEPPRIVPPETAIVPARWAAEYAELAERLPPSDVEQEPILRKLYTLKIDMGFESSTLEEIIAFIRDFTGLNIIFDARVRDQVDLEVLISFMTHDEILRETLERLLAHYGLTFAVTDERVILITAPGLRAVRSRDLVERVVWADQNDAVQRALDEMIVSVDFTDASVAEVLEFLQNGTGIAITADFEARVTLRMSGCLGELLKRLGDDYRVREGKVEVFEDRY